MLSLLFLTGSAFAQETTPNLIGNTWNNVITGPHPHNCCTGGPAPLYDPNTNTIHFSYGQTAVHQVIGINTALQGTGIQINGWNWGYDLRNMNGWAGGQGGTDTINATSFITNDSGQIVQQSDQFYNTQFDWTRFSGTENLNSPLLLGNNVRLGIQFVSSDSGFWAGYYGPQVRNVTLSANYGVDQCTINPLSSSSCPGYAAAYLTQQCTANPLFDPTCPGYTTAQCNINPLFMQSCPGYAAAYYSQQCSLNSLYDIGCPGYAQAYLNYQCSVDPLYSTSCSGYQQAYFNQQCSLNGLYSTQCPNYSEAYATKQALEQSSKPTTVTNETSTPTVSSSGETKVSLVSDPLVNEVVTATATSASPAQAATATVPLVQPPQQTQTVTTAVVVQEQKKDDKKDDTTTSSSSSSSSNTTASDSSSSSSKDQPKTARQELQERRQAAARAKAVEDGKNLAENVGKAADMEQQKAVQNVVVQAMSFVPGFDAYSKVTLTDKPFYKPEQIYKGQVNVDNKVLSRRMFGPTDQLHNEMVESQYQR